MFMEPMSFSVPQEVDSQRGAQARWRKKHSGFALLTSVIIASHRQNTVVG